MWGSPAEVKDCEIYKCKFLELDVADPIVSSTENNIPPSSSVSLSLPIISIETNIQVDNEISPHNDDDVDDPIVNGMSQPIEPNEVILFRRSTRQRKPTLETNL